MSDRRKKAWEIVEGAEQRPDMLGDVAVTYADGIGDGTAVKLCLLDLRDQIRHLQGIVGGFDLRFREIEKVNKVIMENII